MQPQPPTPPAMPIRPSWWHVLWAIPFLVAGAVFSVETLTSQAPRLTDSVQRFIVPGVQSLDLKAGRTYTVYHEYRSVIDGRVYSHPETVEGLLCGLTAMDGSQVPLHPPGMNETYQLNGRYGRAILEFEVDADGRYTLACDYAQNPPGPRLVLAIGSGVLWGIFGVVARVLGGIAFGLVALAVMVVYISVKRDRAKRALQSTPLASSSPMT